VTTVESVLIELPALPTPQSDVVQESGGYSAELSVERELSESERDAFSEAVLRLAPVIRTVGESEVRGLVSVDEDTLWVYVHEVGPGRYGEPQRAAARALAEELWRTVHEAATDR